MGVTGGNAPTGLKRREARTIFLRAPYSDWAALMQGAKTEFRMPFRGGLPLLQVPTPVVIYATSSRAHLKTKLMVLLDHQRGTLIDLAEDPDGLLREGVPSYDHFRTYWRRRTRRPFHAGDKVDVYQVAPWSNLSSRHLAPILLERLYGDFLDQ